MKRLLLLSLALAIMTAGQEPAAQQPAGGPASLVSSWTLTTVERGVSGGKPERVQGPRGLLVFDSAGNVFEFFSTSSRQLPDAPQADPVRAFASYGGFWGRYRLDADGKRITFTSLGAVSPSMMGREFSRTLGWEGERLTLTSVDEPHAQGGSRWTWERVPTLESLSPLYRQVVGFWENVGEKRLNLTTGATLSETKRAPSVIVYTPGGMMGVHFPSMNRKPFAGDTPTVEEARAALQGFIGYSGALTLYPGLVFHNITAGLNPATGSTLRRFVELKGKDEAIVRLPTNANQQGQQLSTIVMLKRLSGVDEMLPRR
jgi:hypothetical protein